jgi:hypothetical protein
MNCNMPSPPAPGAAAYGMSSMMVRQPTASPATFSMPPPMPPTGASLPVGPYYAMSPEDPNAYHYFNFGQRPWPYQTMTQQNYSMPPNMPGTMPGNMPGSDMDFGFGDSQNFGQGGDRV